ncbi:lamin tail domain-containing protein [Lacipirellula parvula]|uniref:LTD domain-containing protein n=1 Tax=Lacipirellula parvula TaxID=2650471 RepID=A0A5K7XQQ1_9BACT|nr:lamin tail domain-containing protein [Lacipirellula parvula]BBO36039.1 hypothetical protein PLANPX_5651 [Lacipirellula parvula]
MASSHRNRRPSSPNSISRQKSAPRKLRYEPLEDRRVLAVVINELHYNPEDNTSQEEFIELYNTGATAVDLSNWAFTDGIEYTFAPGQQIAAGGYLVIAQSPATILAEFGVNSIGPYTGGLSSDGELVELRNAQGQIIDQVDYKVSFPWPIAADGNGASMELINPALDNNLGSSWRPSYVTPMFPAPSDPPPPAGTGLLSNIVHRWSFNGNLNDSVGGSNATLVDPGHIASYSGGRLNVSANSGQSSDQTPFASGAYVDLPNGIISSLSGNATFEWWGTVSTNRTWAEIFSFGRSSGGEDRSTGALNQEYVTLIPQASSGTLRLTHRNGGTQTESSVDWTSAPTPGVEYQFVSTWDTVNDVQKLYVNGVLVGTSQLLIDLIDIEDVNNWLGRSQWGDPLFDGFHNEFRIYDKALTAADVSTSYAAGPDAVAPGPTISAFNASAAEILVGQPVTLSWNVAGATSISINQGVGTVTGQNQIVLNPTQTTTYTLSATNAQGTNTRTVKVVVEHPRATPGAQNNVFATNAAPAIRQVNHTENPVSGTSVTVSAKVTDPEGVASVVLQYQVVLPGQYLPARLPVPVDQLIADETLQPTANPAYFAAASWTNVSMLDNGAGVDAAAGDSIFSVALPPQSHRTLVRYRIVVTDALGKSATVPYEDDASLNFAYFVYDGVPEYKNNANQVVADAAALASLPVYQFLTRAEDMTAVNGYEPSQEIPQGTEARSAYNWSGTMVYNGVVYDNITYRLRGANGRYLTDGKRSMRFRFNDGSWFEPLDNNGVPYPEKWKTLTTGKGFDNRQTLTYSLNEAMTMMLSNLMGLPAAETHWFQFRVIDGAAEAPDQWRGDFWGINFAMEDYDKRFLDAHDMEAGNLYKLINQSNDALRQQDYQAPFAVSDGSDHDYMEEIFGRASTDIEFRVNLQKYFIFRALAEAVRHYDYWPTGNKNMVYYFEPDYLPQNDNFGKLWIMLWDTDATWGPTWNDGKDLVQDALFENQNVAYRNSLINPAYYNTLRELRDLIWQPDQIKGMLDELVSKILPLEAADRARWQGAPADAGNYNGLGGAGATSLTALVQDMMNFAFVGGSWPGGDVGPGGRASYLDGLLNASGEESQIPNTPTITYVGAPGKPADGLAFQTTAFADPQGNATFGAVQWRLAKVTDVAAGLDVNRTFLDEFTASWDSGALTVNSNVINAPASAVTPGGTYRARVRYQDATGRWSHWSAPLEFVAGANASTPSLVISELHYNPASNPAVADSQDLEFIEVLNTGTQTLNLEGVQLATFASTPYTFGAGLTLAAGQRIVVPKNPTAFQSVYGSGVYIAGGGYGTANLSNGGEVITLVAANGTVLQTIEYDDAAPWPTAPDGGGPSLEFFNLAGDPNSGANWRASSMTGGSPGWDGTPGLAGDYNRDNRVDGVDFLTWQRTYGNRTPALVGADGSGNLLVDAPDLTIWKTNFGQSQTIAAAASSGATVAAAVMAPASLSAMLVEESTPMFTPSTSADFAMPAGLPFLAAGDASQRRFDAAFSAFGDDDLQPIRRRESANGWLQAERNGRTESNSVAWANPKHRARRGELHEFSAEETELARRDAAIGVLEDRHCTVSDDELL